MNTATGAGANISVHIENLLQRGYGLHGAYVSEIQNLEAPGSKIAKDLVSEGFGALAADLFGSRKARRHGKNVTKAFFDAQTDQAKQQIVSHYYSDYQSWRGQVIALLEQVSIPKPRLTAPGNSSVLLGRANRADSPQKLDTKIKHLLTFLEGLQTQALVWNSLLPKELPKLAKEPRQDARGTLNYIENLLRSCIERELSKFSHDWWAELIPSDIRRRAESRMSRGETVWPWHQTTSQRLVDFLDFSDYKKIILENDNWTNIFKSVFVSQPFIESKLQELEPIRNDIAHSRMISVPARTKLQIYFLDLKSCIERRGI